MGGYILGELMKKIILFTIMILFSTALFAYSDSDMDGVADKVDKCPNTPLLDLVDNTGCTKKNLVPKITKQHFDIIIGANYSDSNFASLNRTATYSSSLQVDYYYGDFSLQGSTSYYKTDGNNYRENGMNDSYVGASYNIKPNQDLLIRLGLGAILPTYDTKLNNNNTDYIASINLSYTKNNLNLFTSYIYSMINDDDVSFDDTNGTVYEYNYKDTNALSVGIGYYVTTTLYVSVSYNISDSIYKNIEDIQTTSLYAYKSINQNWFMTLFYAYGLSDSASDNAVSVKLGYYF